jgi:hypothetical protein
MSFAQKRFANQTDTNASRRRFNRRAKSRAARADNQNVVFKCLIFSHNLKDKG